MFWRDGGGKQQPGPRTERDVGPRWSDDMRRRWWIKQFRWTLKVVQCIIVTGQPIKWKSSWDIWYLEDDNVINEALMNKWSSVRRDYSLHAQEGPDFYFSYSPVIHVSQTHARSLFPPLIQTSTQQRSDTPKSLAYRPAAVFWINFLCALCERE